MRQRPAFYHLLHNHQRKCYERTKDADEERLHPHRRRDRRARHEVEATDCGVEALKARGRGRPSILSGPADVVPVRIDPEMKATIGARAEAD